MAKRRSSSNTNPNASVSRGESLVWTEEMDGVLIRAFIHEQEIGNRPNGTFTSQAYDNIVKELKQAYPDKPVDKDKIKNRIKYLKKGFGACYDIFRNATSGFQWSPHTKMWQAEPEVWAKLIQSYPLAAEWMNKPVLHYEELKKLYGKDRANGDIAETPAEMRQRLAQQLSGTEGEVIAEIDRMVSQNEATLNETEDENVSSSPEGNKRHKGKPSKEEVQELIIKGIERISEAIIKSTDALVKAHTSNLSMPTEEIWKHVDELDLDPSKRRLAYRFLVQEPDMLQAVLGCPFEERKDFLMENLPRS